MKKQLLIAAVAASIAGVASADISIGGSAKFNATDGVYKHEADLNVKGTSGATSVTMNISMDGTTAPTIEDAYVSTSVAGVKVKMGGWRSGKNELGHTSGMAERVNASTSFGGISLAYEDTGASNSTTIGGSLAGVSLSHKIKQSTATETKASGSIGGVAVKVHSKEDAAGDQDTSVTLTTDIQGVTLTYSRIDADGTGTSTDGYITKDTLVTDADAIGVKTSISGNTVQFKAITVDGTDTNKVIVTRGLSAGATFEATYADKDGADPTLDLELAVKF